MRCAHTTSTFAGSGVFRDIHARYIVLRCACLLSRSPSFSISPIIHDTVIGVCGSPVERILYPFPHFRIPIIRYAPVSGPPALLSTALALTGRDTETREADTRGAGGCTAGGSPWGRGSCARLMPGAILRIREIRRARVRHAHAYAHARAHVHAHVHVHVHVDHGAKKTTEKCESA